MTADVVVLLGGSALLAALWWRARAARDAALVRARDTERALVIRQELVDRLTAGLSGASEGLIVLDAQGDVVAINHAAERLANLAATGCRGRHLRDLLPWPQLPDALANCHQSDEGILFELEDAGDEGLVLAVRVRCMPGLGVVVAIDDQSRLKRLESLRRDFVANVSHELKTPLAAIQGFVETMLDDPNMPPPTRHRFLERIARQTERLTTLVADLLTLSRLDEDQRVGGLAEPCDMVAVLRETVRDLGSMADQRGVRLVAELPAQPLPVRADREGLRQVAGNLIDNAIKYTAAGGKVTVQVALTEGRVLLEVIDTGIGLEPEDQVRIFERFYRVDRARSRDIGGTGLGLSIVKNTVRNLGGEVGVRSVLGQGSTFWVALPSGDESQRPPAARDPA